MKGYPQVIDEETTLRMVAEGQSIARYGDGELRLATDGTCISQREAPEKLRQELRDVLKKPIKNLQVGIPNVFSKTPKHASWLRYAAPKFCDLYRGRPLYCSSFITRPDSAPWIDRPDYWELLDSIWKGRDVTLVRGKRSSLLVEELLETATSVREIVAPEKNAYSEVDRLMNEVLAWTAIPHTPILLCLGPTATIMAARLAARGLWALDLGHVGQYRRHRGAFSFRPDDLVSPEYRAALRQYHEDHNWGGDGHKHAAAVSQLIDETQAATVLDYGAGRGALATTLGQLRPGQRVSNYDPGRESGGDMPKPCHVVACTDVLEHVEPNRLDNVLRHLYAVTGRGAYVVISTRPAKAVLADGRNAHISLHSPEWWQAELCKLPWTHARYEYVPGGKELRAWLYKRYVA